jgi:hypothetical protein
VTTLLEQALDRVSKLPIDQQEAIAALILEELEDEQQWEAQFAASQEKLCRMAAKVRADIQAGRVRTSSLAR